MSLNPKQSAQIPSIQNSNPQLFLPTTYVQVKSKFQQSLQIQLQIKSKTKRKLQVKMVKPSGSKQQKTLIRQNSNRNNDNMEQNKRKISTSLWNKLSAISKNWSNPQFVSDYVPQIFQHMKKNQFDLLRQMQDRKVSKKLVKNRLWKLFEYRQNPFKFTERQKRAPYLPILANQLQSCTNSICSQKIEQTCLAQLRYTPKNRPSQYTQSQINQSATNQHDSHHGFDCHPYPEANFSSSSNSQSYINIDKDNIPQTCQANYHNQHKLFGNFSTSPLKSKSSFQRLQQIQINQIFTNFKKGIANLNKNIQEQLRENININIYKQQQQQQQSPFQKANKNNFNFNFNINYRNSTTTTHAKAVQRNYQQKENELLQQQQQQQQFSQDFFNRIILLIIKMAQYHLLTLKQIVSAANLFYLVITAHPQLQQFYYSKTDQAQCKCQVQDQCSGQCQQNEQQKQDTFILQFVQYIVSTVFSFSSKLAYGDSPDFISIVQSINSDNKLTFQIAVQIQRVMFNEMVIDKNVLRFQWEDCWLTMLQSLLGWQCQQQKKCDSFNKFDKKWFGGVNYEYHIQTCNFIMECGLTNIGIYRFAVSKRAATIISIFIRYWLRKELTCYQVSFVWELVNLSFNQYHLIQKQYILALKYIRQNDVDQIKEKYFTNFLPRGYKLPF